MCKQIGSNSFRLTSDVAELPACVDEVSDLRLAITVFTISILIERLCTYAMKLCILYSDTIVTNI